MQAFYFIFKDSIIRKRNVSQVGPAMYMCLVFTISNNFKRI